MSSDFLLFAQHGWADDNSSMMALALDLAPDATAIVAPSLDYAMTWLRMAPLIEAVERLATETIHQYPGVPLRIIGHSMGGLIWLEVLTRHPEWWPQVHSLVLLASPVGGADLGRIIDPLKVGLGIAADLGADRRPMARPIAEAIKTLVIAGDIDGGSDGTITIESTKVPQAQFVCLAGVSHPAMRHHPLAVDRIQRFWAGEDLSEPLVIHPIIQTLRQVPGMTDAHLRNFDQAETLLTLEDGTTLRAWCNPLGIYHVFVASAQGHCLYSGYVGWIHTDTLWQTLRELQATAGTADWQK